MAYETRLVGDVIHMEDNNSLPGSTLDLNFQTLSDDTLVELLKNMKRTIEILQSENSIFERHHDRVTAFFASTTGLNILSNPKKNSENEEEESTAALLSKQKRKKMEKKDIAAITLSMDQKIDIATREVDEMKDYIEDQKKEWAKIVDNYYAELECSETTVSELKKEMFEFKRDIVTNATDSRTKKVMAEKLLRHYEEKIRAKV
jgi:hypothetical protein